MKAKHQLRIRDASPDRQPKIHSSLVKEDLQRIMGKPTTTADFRSSFWQISTSATFACWKKRFKTEVSTCSQFPTEALLWIKEVEMVESVDDLKSSCSVRGIRMLDFDVLDAKIASALNRIIHNTRFKRKGQSGGTKSPKRGSFSFFNDSVENCADLFTMVLRKDDIQEFDAKWDGILLAMTRITSDDIFEGLYKLRIRESEKLKNVLEVYNMEIHQKKAGPDYHRLKTMVKRSIEQNLRIENFEARNGNHETNAVVKDQGTKQREQGSLGDCWHWKANGQCSEGDNCTFRHDVNKRAKTTQPNPSPSFSTRQNERNASRTRSPRGRSSNGRMFRLPCKDYIKGTCTSSFCEKWHPPECLFCKSENGCSFGEHCSYAHRQVEEQPGKRSKKNNDKSAVAMLKSTRQLSCVFQDMELLKSSSILRKSSNIRKPIRCVKLTKAVVRHADIRDQNPPLGMICPGDPQQRNPQCSKI